MVIGRWIFYPIGAIHWVFKWKRGWCARASYQELGEWTLIATDSAWGVRAKRS